MRAPFVCLIVLGCLTFWCAAAGAADSMLSHDVYFTLNHDSDDAKEKLLAGCKEYLAGHPGVVWFAAGILAEDFDRDVNDRQFHVALHMVFKDKASHDRYRDSDRHHKFIEEFQESWKAVRVFDSSVNTFLHADTVQKKKGQPDKSKKGQPDKSKKGQPDKPKKGQPDKPNKDQPDKPKNGQPDKPRKDQPDKPKKDQPGKPKKDQPDKPKKGQPDKPKKDQPDKPKKGQPSKPKKDQPDKSKPRLPDPAASFAGMISGKVVTKYDSGEFVLSVAKVVKQWRTSKAADANSLVGKTVLVAPRKDGGQSIAKFIRSLKLGEVITIDVAHTGKGEALTIIELTERQRERVK